MASPPTPLEEAPPALAAGRRLLLKREDVHELGAFKWRGALPALAPTATRARARWSPRRPATTAPRPRGPRERTGLRAVVYVPGVASRAKLAVLEGLGAEVRQDGADLDEAKDAGARPRASATGCRSSRTAPSRPSSSGYAEIGREIVEQLGERPALTVVPVGNGALLIGVARGLGGAAPSAWSPKGRR